MFSPRPLLPYRRALQCRSRPWSQWNPGLLRVPARMLDCARHRSIRQTPYKPTQRERLAYCWMCPQKARCSTRQWFGRQDQPMRTRSSIRQPSIPSASAHSDRPRMQKVGPYAAKRWWSSTGSLKVRGRSCSNLAPWSAGSVSVTRVCGARNEPAPARVSRG